MLQKTRECCRVTPNGDHVSYGFALEDVGELKSSWNLDPPSPLEPQKQGEESYGGWLERYPNALQSFGELEQKLKGKRMAVFLDYDGTLTPIVKNPEDAFMSEDMRKAVRDISELYPTAIISGRGLEKVQRFVKLEDLCYAGSHGLDICAPRVDLQRHAYHGSSLQPAAELKLLINHVYDELRESVRHINGAYVEHNTFCLSVHFRNCHMESLDEIKDIVEETVDRHKPKLKFTSGRKVFDIRPAIDWGKGKAVEHFLSAWSCEGDDVVPIYVGDDRTDEDAFQFLRQRKNPGIGILVSTVVKPSHAEYSLRDPSEVLLFLKRLITWSRTCDE